MVVFQSYAFATIPLTSYVSGCFLLSRDEMVSWRGEPDAGKDRARRAFRSRRNGCGQCRLFSKGGLARAESPTARYPGPPLAGNGFARHRNDAAFAERTGGAGDPRSQSRRRAIKPGE